MDWVSLTVRYLPGTERTSGPRAKQRRGSVSALPTWDRTSVHAQRRRSRSGRSQPAGLRGAAQGGVNVTYSLVRLPTSIAASSDSALKVLYALDTLRGFDCVLSVLSLNPGRQSYMNLVPVQSFGYQVRRRAPPLRRCVWSRRRCQSRALGAREPPPRSDAAGGHDAACGAASDLQPAGVAVGSAFQQLHLADLRRLHRHLQPAHVRFRGQPW